MYGDTDRHGNKWSPVYFGDRFTHKVLTMPVVGYWEYVFAGTLEACQEYAKGRAGRVVKL